MVTPKACVGRRASWLSLNVWNILHDAYCDKLGRDYVSLDLSANASVAHVTHPSPAFGLAGEAFIQSQWNTTKKQKKGVKKLLATPASARDVLL
jgi:hypothetical protein